MMNDIDTLEQLLSNMADAKDNSIVTRANQPASSAYNNQNWRWYKTMPKKVLFQFGVVAAISFLLAITIGLLYVGDRLIETSGEFDSPSGKYFVRITEADGQRTLETFSREKPNEPKSTAILAAFGGWFAAWSDDDRLWYYVGSPTITIYNLRDGGMLMTDNVRKWQGIPEVFLDRLPTRIVREYKEWQQQRKEK